MLFLGVAAAIYPVFVIESTTMTITDANSPAWLQDNTAEAPAPAESGGITTVSPPPPPPPTNSTNASATDGVDDPDLPGVILTMRLANMGVAIAIIVISVRC